MQFANLNEYGKTHRTTSDLLIKFVYNVLNSGIHVKNELILLLRQPQRKTPLPKHKKCGFKKNLLKHTKP